jgi:hypothetical protein
VPAAAEENFVEEKHEKEAPDGAYVAEQRTCANSLEVFNTLLFVFLSWFGVVERGKRDVRGGSGGQKKTVDRKAAQLG